MVSDLCQRGGRIAGKQVAECVVAGEQVQQAVHHSSGQRLRPAVRLFRHCSFPPFYRFVRKRLRAAAYRSPSARKQPRMRVRRCKVLYLEPREEVAFDLQDLLAGGDGVARQRRWFALAPHSRGQVPVDAAARDVLGGLSPERWVEEEMLSPAQREALPALVEAGLVVCDEPAHAAMLARDEALRAAHWHPLAATAHALTRWNGVDTTEAMRNTGTQTAPELRQVLGPPPPEAIVPPRAGAPLPLPVPEATGFDPLLR